jgi:hypothetical protein
MVHLPFAGSAAENILLSILFWLGVLLFALLLGVLTEYFCCHNYIKRSTKCENYNFLPQNIQKAPGNFRK